MTQCYALLKNGERCFRLAVENETLCESHLNNPTRPKLYQFAKYTLVSKNDAPKPGNNLITAHPINKHWDGFSSTSLAKRTVQPYEYKEYLQSEAWRQKSAETKTANPRCSLCNRRSKIMHAHHRTYCRLGNENFDDLTVLCDDCHNLFHRNYDYDNKTGCFAPRGSAQHSVQRTHGGHKRKARKGKSKSKRFAPAVSR